MLTCEHIHYRYPGGSEAILKGISFQVNPGERVALMGGNGSGKTTLAYCLNGLIHPQEGQLKVDGLIPCLDEDYFEIRRRVGMVFQNPDNQIVAATVEREIAFGLENTATSHPVMIRRVEEALERFLLRDVRQAPPHELSGGERQRLALASVWVMRPRYYILDEPTSLLDPAGRRAVFDFIEDQVREESCGVLLVTQFGEEALSCDRLTVLDAGEIVYDASPDIVFQSYESLMDLGIDVPVSVSLSRFMEQVLENTD